MTTRRSSENDSLPQRVRGRRGGSCRTIASDAALHAGRRPRYTEASLVRALEEKGIGRPSTYAPTISRPFMARGYVMPGKEAACIPPSWARMVTSMMEDVLRGHRGCGVHRRAWKSKLDEGGRGRSWTGSKVLCATSTAPFEQTLEDWRSSQD